MVSGGMVSGGGVMNRLSIPVEQRQFIDGRDRDPTDGSRLGLLRGDDQPQQCRAGLRHLTGLAPTGDFGAERA